jgi:hypothetical protein
VATTLTTDSVRVARSEQTDAGNVADGMPKQALQLVAHGPVGAKQRQRHDRGELC